MQYRTVSDTAIAGRDFVAKTGTITLNEGETAASIEVQIIDDAIGEPNFDEQFHVELFGPTGGAGLSRQRATVRIFYDDDFGPLVQLYGQDGKFVEGGSARLLLYRSGDMRGALTLDYTITPITATAGNDYTATGGTVQWAANEGGVREVSVALVDDSLVEMSEQFTVNFTDPTGVFGGPGSATITIIDDDDTTGPSAVAFGARSVYVDEGAGSATFTVHRPRRLLAGTERPLADVDVFRNRRGSARPGLHHLFGHALLVCWRDRDQDVFGCDRRRRELRNDRRLRALPQPHLSRHVPRRLEQHVLIKDNDGTPAQAVASLGAATVVSESAGTITVPVTLSGLPAGPVTVSVDWAIEGETASTNDVANFLGTLTWNSGDNATKNLSITIADDTRDETDETFVVYLSRPRYGVSIGTSQQRFTITDDDPTPAGQNAPVPPGVAAVSAVSVSENQRTATVELRRVGDTTGTLYVYYNLVDGTAASPADFLTSAGLVNWNANDTATKRVEVQINGDAVLEPTETLSLNVSPYTILGNGPTVSIPITITDDDAPAPPARVGFIDATASVAESATSMTVQVGCTGNTAVASSVDYTMAAGSADAADFTGASGTLTWAAGDASSKMITIALLPDVLDEPNETFTITLSNASSGTEIDTAIATMTIQDDDAAPSPPPGGGGGSGGGGGGGGGAESYLTLLVLAAVLMFRRRRAPRP